MVPFQRAVVQLVSIENCGSYQNLEVSMNMCVARHMQIEHTAEHRLVGQDGHVGSSLCPPVPPMDSSVLKLISFLSTTARFQERH